MQRLSRDQVRRAVSGLVRSGAITVQSEGLHLILKCELATRAYSVQNKAATNPPQKAAINIDDKSLLDTECLGVESWKGDTAETSKAATPLKEEKYIYLLSQFEKFWSCYPEKKSRNNALQAFQAINPEPSLFNQIMQALEAQIQHRETKQASGLWVPPWKFPANWCKRSGKHTYKAKIKTCKISIFKGQGIIDVKIRSRFLGRDIQTI